MTDGSRSAQTFGAIRPATESSLTRRAAVLADYLTLTKLEVNLLIVITTFVGFYLASPPLPSRARSIAKFMKRSRLARIARTRRFIFRMEIQPEAGRSLALAENRSINWRERRDSNPRPPA